MNQTEDFLIAKTVPSCYFLHLEPTEFEPGYWLNFALVSEIIERFDGTIFIKLMNDRSYTFTGEHAIAILDELQAIRKRYQ